MAFIEGNPVDGARLTSPVASIEGAPVPAGTRLTSPVAFIEGAPVVVVRLTSPLASIVGAPVPAGTRLTSPVASIEGAPVPVGGRVTVAPPTISCGCPGVRTTEAPATKSVEGTSVAGASVVSMDGRRVTVTSAW